MKVLLINPPSEKEFSLFVSDYYNQKARSNQVPLGLLYLESYLKEWHNIEILDMNSMDMPIHHIENQIKSLKPDIIGITCVISKWSAVRELSKKIRSICSIPIVVGGMNPSLYPWETLQWPYIDYVISGFGQRPLQDLCFKLQNNFSTNYIPYIYTKTNCKTKIKGEFNLLNVDYFPLPDREILNTIDYIMPFFPENPVTSMITSLGCPYKCGFCASKNLKPVILREPEKIVAEMKHIESLGIRGILFNDELFTMSTKRIKEICSLIINQDIKLCWSVRSRANLVHKESLKLMKTAGCFNIHLGIESGTDRILKEMKKGINIATIKKSVSMIKETGLSVTSSFMIGYPDETETEIMQTIQFAKDLELNSAQFFIVQPEPRTELYEQIKDIKNLPDDIYSSFTLDPDSVDLTQNIASTIFNKKELEDFIKYAYSQVRGLYNIKGEHGKNT